MRQSRYQLTALAIGLLTVLVLAAASTLFALNLGAGDDDRRQVAARAEFAALEAALQARADALSDHAAALLQQDAVLRFAATGGTSPPPVLTHGRASRGGADYLVVSGPGRTLVYQDGLPGSFLDAPAGADGAPSGAAQYLLDGAPEGGVFDFAEGPVLAAGASTDPTLERAAIALGVRLDAETLATLAGDNNRRVSLVWTEDGAADGVTVGTGVGPDRVEIRGPLALAQGQRTLIATIDAPASALPDGAGQGAWGWLLGLVLLGGVGLAALGLVVRRMAGGVTNLRSGLLAAQETDGNAAVLESLAGPDEVGRAAEQAANTLQHLQERAAILAEEASVAAARQMLGEHVIRSMHEGVLVERSDGVCIVVNPAAARLLGVAADEMLGVQDGISHALGADLYARLVERARAHSPSGGGDVHAVGGRDLAFEAFRMTEHRGNGRGLLILIREVAPPAGPALMAPLALVRGVLEGLRARAEARGVTLLEAAEGDLPASLAGEEAQVALALEYLVANAIRFAPPGSNAWVVLRGSGDRVHLDVADSGPGVALERRERVFEEGEHLAEVRRIAEAAGGRVELLPTEQGAYFRFTLPAAHAE